MKHDQCIFNHEGTLITNIIMIIAFLLPIFMLSLYILVKLGVYKSWYILKPAISVASPNFVFAALPAGIAMSYLYILATFFNFDSGNRYSSTPFFLMVMITLLFLIWQPKFIKPKWLIQVEQKYSYIVPLLINEGRKCNHWQWESMVRTQEDMQKWIESVVKTHADEEKARWILYKFTEIAKHYDFKNKPSRNYQVGDSVPLDLVPEHRRFDRTIISMDEYKLFIAVDRYFEETGQYSVLKARSK